MMFFSGLGALAIIIYLFLIVLVAMFLFKGFVYFGRKVETDQALLQKLDLLIETLKKEKHNTNGKE